MSNTQNIKLGTCNVYFGGVDLGYTQGGVEMTVSTDTHKVNVDQFGKSTVNEVIQGRDCMVKVPLAETTLANLVQIMPGATLIMGGEAYANGSFTVNSIPAAGDTLTVNGVTFTFAVAAAGLPYNEIPIAGSVIAQAQAIQQVLSEYEDPNVAEITYGYNGALVGLTSVLPGSAGNAYTLSAKTAAANAIAVSGANLVGGVDAHYFVSVTNGVGTSLLSVAKQLILHPKELPATDHSQDVVIPTAATAGAIKYTFKLDTERLFDVTFTAYPNPATGVLFEVGATY